MLILLPPSEGKSSPRRGRPLDLATLSFPELEPTRARVLEALIQVSSRSDAAEILGLTPGLSAEITRNISVPTAPATKAGQLYTGVLYDALSLATLSSAAKRRASSRVAITSSLFGMVRPGDRIPAYRLSGNVTLPGLGSVAGAWRTALGPAGGDPIVNALGDGLLVDLRSTTYAAFWRPPVEVARRVATVRVLHEVDGQRKVVSHFNKATKGRIVRAVLESGGNPRRPAALADLLRDLGWKVEETAPDRRGTQLDVVVDTI